LGCINSKKDIPLTEDAATPGGDIVNGRLIFPRNFDNDCKVSRLLLL
jgi:hypothetical protein